MDIGSIYIGALLLLICIAPLLYFWAKRKKKEKQLKQSITRLAAENNCELTRLDMTADLSIGIDEQKKWVFFYKMKTQNPLRQFVDLSKVSSCKIDKQLFSSGNGIVDKLDLVFYFKNKNKAPECFQFYSRTDRSQMSDELLLINQWQPYLSKLMN